MAGESAAARPRFLIGVVIAIVICASSSALLDPEHGGQGRHQQGPAILSFLHVGRSATNSAKTSDPNSSSPSLAGSPVLSALQSGFGVLGAISNMNGGSCPGCNGPIAAAGQGTGPNVLFGRWTDADNGNGQIFGMAADGTSLAQFTNLLTPSSVKAVNFSADSTKLLYAVDGISGGNPTAAIEKANTDGSQRNLLTTISGCGADALASATSNSATYVVCDSAPSSNGARIVKVATNGSQSVIYSSTGTTWVPTTISVSSTGSLAVGATEPNGGATSIRGMDGSGGSQTLLAGGIANQLNQSPVFSADGTMIAFWSDRGAAGGPQLFTMTAAGASITSVGAPVYGQADGVFPYSPISVAWASATRLIYECRDLPANVENHSLCAINTNGTSPALLTNDGFSPVARP